MTIKNKSSEQRIVINYKQKYFTKMSQKVLTQEDQSLIINEEKVKSIEYQPEKEQIEINPVSKIENLIGLVTHQIQNEIQQSRITISQQTVPLKLLKKPFEINDKNNSILAKNLSQKIDEKKIAEIVRKRNDLQQEMLRLKLQQEQERHKSRSKSPSQTKYHRTFKSSFTIDDHKQINWIMKKSEKFQKDIQHKQKQLLSRIQEQKIKSMKQRQHYILKLKEKKKQESLKKIQMIQQQQQSRIQSIRSQNKRYQEVRKSKALHEKIEENQRLQQERKRQEQLNMLREKRKSMALDAEQLKSHEKRYYETARMSKQKIGHQFLERIQKMKENEILQAQTYRPSKFLMTLMNEQKLKEIQQHERIEKMKQLFSKKNSFHQKLRQIHKQKIKTKPKAQEPKSIIEIKVEDRRLKAKSMSAADIYRQGQQYMKSAHSSINNLLIEKSKLELQQSYKALKQGSKAQYKNYLLQSRVKRQEQHKSTGKLTKIRQSNPEINELQAIIRSKNQRETEKLYKAKLIAQKLDKKAKSASTSALVDSIAAKLKIIEQFG